MTIRDIAIAFGFVVDKNSEKKVNDSINSLKNTATKMLGYLGVGFSLSQINEIVEQFKATNRQLKSVTGNLVNQKELQDRIMQSASNIRISYDATAKAVSSYMSQSKKVLKTSDEALNFVELTTKAWKAAGKEESTIASLHSTLAKAFQKNIIDAGTFESLLSQSPETIKYLEQSLGKTRTQLKAMADAGVLKASHLTEAFTKSADAINAAYAETGITIKEALQIAKDKIGLLLSQYDDSLEVTKTIAKWIVDITDKVVKVSKIGIEFIKKITDKLGGTENALKLIGIVMGAFLSVKTIAKIKIFIDSMKKFNLVAGIANLKVLAIIAAIALLFLIIEDIVGFINGKDSVFGDILKKAGLDVDKTREKIKNFFSNIKNWLSENKALIAIESIVAGLGVLFMHLRKTPFFLKMIVGGLKTVSKIKGFGSLIKDAKKAGGLFKSLGGAIKKSNFVKSIAGLLGGLEIKIVLIIGLIMAIIAVIYLAWKNWDKISAWFKKSFDKLTSWWEDFKKKTSDKVNQIKESISSAFQKVVDWFKNNWLALLMLIINPFAGALMLLYNNNEKFRNAVDNLLNKIKEKFGELKQKLKDKVSEWKDGIEEGFSAVKTWFEELPSRALQWGKDMLSGFINGILGKKSDLEGAVEDVTGTIDSNLHHTTPDEGPLKDDDKWMPDFIDNLSNGLRKGLPKIRAAVRNLATELSVFASASPSPVTQNISQGATSQRIINQYNNWTNNFNGGTKQEQSDLASASDSQVTQASKKLGTELAYTR